VDASVVVKWLLPTRDGESHFEEAEEILRGIAGGKVEMCQPPHWLAEAAAVVARLNPETAEVDVEDLAELRFRTIDRAEVYTGACRLAIDLRHHLFDTLYHAVALYLEDALLVTADEHYYRKARHHGRMVRLADISNLIDFP